MSIRVLVTGSRTWTDTITIRRAFNELGFGAHSCGTDNYELRFRLATSAELDRGARFAQPDHTAQPPTLIHGACRGADLLCAAEATNRGWTIEPHPALWNVHGRAAGPIRNQAMLDLGADIVLAFPMPDSRGTADMIRRVERRPNLPLWIYHPQLHPNTELHNLYE